MASAIVGSPRASCHVAKERCEITTVDAFPQRSSSTSRKASCADYEANAVPQEGNRGSLAHELSCVGRILAPKSTGSIQVHDELESVLICARDRSGVGPGTLALEACQDGKLPNRTTISHFDDILPETGILTAIQRFSLPNRRFLLMFLVAGATISPIPERLHPARLSRQTC